MKKDVGIRTPLHVLIVEDSEDDSLLLVRQLERSGYAVTFERVESATAMNMALERQAWDIVIADYAVPGFNGLAALALLQKKGFDLPFIIVSGAVGEDIAVEVMKAGAHDYVMKGNLTRLIPAVDRELREAEIRRDHKRAEAALRRSETRYRLLAENATDLIWTVDTNLRFTYVSPSIKRILGYEG